MTASDLQSVVRAVLQRAEQRGYVLASEVRQELKKADLAPDRWREVVEQLHESLHLRSGRYHFIASVRSHLHSQQQQLQAVQQAVRVLLEQQPSVETGPENRRQEERVPFVQSLKVRTEDGRELTLLSRDLSAGGLRLIGSASFLGQKLTVELPQGENASACPVVVRILWTAAVGDGLFENGGKFVGMG